MEKLPLLLLPGRQGNRVVHFADICCCKAEQGYVGVYLRSGERLLATGKLKQMEAMLPSPPFFRCHHSWLVNLLCVVDIVQEGHRATLRVGEADVPVARERKADLLVLFHKL